MNSIVQNLKYVNDHKNKNNLIYSNKWSLPKFTPNIEPNLFCLREGEAEERSRWEGAGGRWSFYHHDEDDEDYHDDDHDDEEDDHDYHHYVCWFDDDDDHDMRGTHCSVIFLCYLGLWLQIDNDKDHLEDDGDQWSWRWWRRSSSFALWDHDDNMLYKNCPVS